MKAAVLDSLGSLPRYGDFDDAVAEPGETLVHVTAAAIKPLDRAIAAGTHYGSPKTLPVVCGMDGVGTTSDGAQVYFWTVRRPYGAMAERAPAAWTVPLPDGLDDALAAAVVNPALAAWLPLQWRGRIRPGGTVMVLGATGAAGQMAVRAARLLGAGRVIAAGRRHDVLASLGADATIDLTLPDDDLAEAFAAQVSRGIGVVVDYVWGRPVELLISTLIKADLGGAASEANVRLVSVGEMAGRSITLPSAALRGSRLEIIGSGTANFPAVPVLQGIVADILDRARSGQLAMTVEPVPLSGVAGAWAADTAGDRTVLTMGR
jgi:NADPH:quinone reductase-like Zn-dependent oxidoreductase